MVRRWGWLLLLVFVLSLMWLAPARLLTYLLSSAQIGIGGLNGTVWNGSAAQVIVAVPDGHLQLGTVSWSLRPLSLLWLSPSAEVTSDWGDQRLKGVVTLHGRQDLTLQDVEFSADAALVRQLAPVALRGRFAGQFEVLALESGQPVEAVGRITWQRAA